MVPPKRTPVAVVQGPQTAVVVGDGEIDCDEYGRILVQFHWDLAGAYSMRCRVSQNWAGAGWGGMVIPRIGMEVIVEFLEGDPDKPIVTGCVYNGKNDAPYPLPEHKTRSTFRTNTHDGKRTGYGFNELRFEDRKGEEEIFVHAQLDMNSEIERDRTAFTGRNEAWHVGAHAFREVRYNQHTRIGMSSYEEVRGDRFELVGGMPHVPSIVAGPDDREKAIWARFFKLPKLLGVGNLLSAVIGYRMQTTMLDCIEKIQGSKTMTTGREFNLSSHASVTVSGRENVLIEGSESIVLRSGNSAIILRQDGKVAITGTELLIATEKSDIETSGMCNIKAAHINLN